ncbi:MAG: retropepsin-like aspartic protease [Gammaproteobacteria bacterium]|nr:retropepsin-like aspartic protease [Gammaproteobacteria bacterium]
MLLIPLLMIASLSLAQADGSVRVLALFSDKAMVNINGKQLIIKKGQVVDGIKLISASGRGAVLQFSDGSQKTLGINQSISSAFKKPQKKKLRVFSDSQGMFMVDGAINGRSTRFLIDTGASHIAISSAEADRLGLDYKNAPTGRVQTASEEVPVWNIKLDRVKVGSINVPQVDAVVLSGNRPEHILLGMTFLQHLNMQREGTAMILEKKY